MATVLHVLSSQLNPSVVRSIGALVSPLAPEFRSHEFLLSRGSPRLRAVGELAAAARQVGADVVHAHCGQSLVLSLAARWIKQLPVVATFHGGPGEGTSLAIASLGNLCSAVASTSEALREQLKRWMPFVPVHPISEGVPVVETIGVQERLRARESLGIASHAPILAVVGEQDEKGFARFAEAAQALQQAPVILFAGSPPPQVISSACAGLRTRSLDPHINARQLYAAADLVVLPSLRAGISIAALEAMAHGRPLLANSVGELPQLLGQGTGTLLRYGSVADWVHTLRRLLRAPKELEAMGQRGREQVRQRYGLEQMANRYVELLYRPAIRPHSSFEIAGGIRRYRGGS